MALLLDDNVKSILKESLNFYSQLITNNQMSQKDSIAYTLIYKMHNKNDFLKNLTEFSNINIEQKNIKNYKLSKEQRLKCYNEMKNYIESLLYRYKNDKMKKEDSLLSPRIVELVFIFMYYHPDITKKLLQLNNEQYTQLINIIEAKILSEHKNTEINTKNNNNTKTNNFALTKFGAENLTSCDYPYNPLVGNEQILRQTIKKILSGDSIIILGEAGVGKTTLVKGIAYNIKMNNVPTILKDKEIISLPVSGIVADTQYVGTLERHIKEIINYAKSHRNSIFYIDEIHTIIGAGSTFHDKTDVANLLKPYISDGTMQIIGATTTREFDNTIATDPAFRRRFRTVTLQEPTEEDVLKIAKHYISVKKEQTKIKWNYNDILLETLIDLTSSKNRNFFETINNPNISLAIIDDIFASALYYEKNYIDKNDIIEGVQDNEILATTIKEKLIQKLSLDEMYDSDIEKQQTKILSFFPYKNNK